MKKGLFRFFLIVLATFVLFVGGCGDSDETKGQKLLGQAEALLEQKEASQAELILSDLIAKYPATPAGKAGVKLLERIREQRDLSERAQFVKILDSVQQVLNGYKAMYAEYPRSIEALDKSDYFFDSDYLAEITPEGYQLYLLLMIDGSGYRSWCVHAGQDLGYTLDANGQPLASFNRAQTLAQLSSKYNAENWDGKIVALSAR